METCDNCLAQEDDLTPVLRVWVLPEPHVADEVERWCVACLTQYPHQPVDNGHIGATD